MRSSGETRAKGCSLSILNSQFSILNLSSFAFGNCFWYIGGMKKIFLLPLLALSLASAELIEPAAPPVAEAGPSGWIGFSVGAASVAESGAPILSVRGGVALGLWRLGIWAATVGSDVQNPANNNEYLDYDALGLLAEPTVFVKNNFSVSIPLLAGAGSLNSNKKGVEESHRAGGAFFTGDAGLLASYRVTRNVRLAAGGGYRFFYGIETHGVSDGDFRTPYGEVQIVYGAF
jgi:hypothetical protein